MQDLVDCFSAETTFWNKRNLPMAPCLAVMAIKRPTDQFAYSSQNLMVNGIPIELGRGNLTMENADGLPEKGCEI